MTWLSAGWQTPFVPSASRCTSCRSGPTPLDSHLPGKVCVDYVQSMPTPLTAEADLITDSRVDNKAETDMTESADVWKCPPALTPIKSLHELLNWNPDKQPFHNLFRSRVPLSQVNPENCASNLDKCCTDTQALHMILACLCCMHMTAAAFALHRHVLFTHSGLAVIRCPRQTFLQ